MSTEFYRAVCYKHHEIKTVFVKSPSVTATFLADKDQEIFDWLRYHYACDLKFIHRDDELDACWEHSKDSWIVDNRIVKSSLI